MNVCTPKYYFKPHLYNREHPIPIISVHITIISANARITQTHIRRNQITNIPSIQCLACSDSLLLHNVLSQTCIFTITYTSQLNNK